MPSFFNIMTFAGKYNGDDDDLEADAEADEADELDHFGSLAPDDLLALNNSRLREENFQQFLSPIVAETKISLSIPQSYCKFFTWERVESDARNTTPVRLQPVI